MRIEAIRISWFRGSADSVAFEPGGKSMVVYGVNGSGKSCFVDAFEYAINDGRIGHLAHEYSGKRQEKAVRNTHTPEERSSELTIMLCDGSALRIEIRPDGTFTRTGGDTAALDTWDYRRTVLRQDEVAQFIHARKGEKYSALLPLLGLERLEAAAENLRQLAKAVREEAGFSDSKSRLTLVEGQRKATFGTDTDDEILAKIAGLHATYCPGRTDTTDPLARCKATKTAIEERTALSSAEQRRHIALQEAASLQLEGQVEAVRDGSARLSGAAEPLITEKLAVLESTGSFVKGLGDEEEVTCPACGRAIPVADLQAHVEGERVRLQELIGLFEARKAAIGRLCDSVSSLKTILGKPDVKSWREDLVAGPLAGHLTHLEGTDPEKLRASCGEDDLKAIEEHLLPLIEAAGSASESAPPEAKELAADKGTVETAEAVIAGKVLRVAVGRAEALIAFIGSLEQGIREELRLRSHAVMDEISENIRTMWRILHPGDAIEDVRLYVPEGADKAIDVGLKFHGVEQDSPRLTLSEGYRNSLGLCIFLAMTKREADRDRPVFLDDVVVSLDRNHRGMIAELLEKEFCDRQVIILTHDREWYTELRQQLDDKEWICRTLLPYETPKLGIRWSHKTTTFDDARAHLKDRPDSAGNDARKIMDVELAGIAERLRIRLPYLRAERNDRRTAHDFLERIAADGKCCFQRKTGSGYERHQEALDCFHEADRLLVSWGNRASHSFDVVHLEAAKLIDGCENALGFFKCSSCGKPVWFANAKGPQLIQCECGGVRWRYGKAKDD